SVQIYYRSLHDCPVAACYVRVTILTELTCRYSLKRWFSRNFRNGIHPHLYRCGPLPYSDRISILLIISSELAAVALAYTAQQRGEIYAAKEETLFVRGILYGGIENC